MDIRKQILTRNKTIATGMMIAAAVLFVIARSRHSTGIWEWIAAFAEAAMVGALADWFAVVALFKHPLGIPIPHTAIIKNKKDAIAENLAVFIRDKFLAPETLTEKLRAYNPAEQFAIFLTTDTNADRLAKGLTRILSDSLDFLDDERVLQILRAVLHDRLEAFDLSSSVGTLLDTLRNGNRHQTVLDEMLGRCAAWISTPEAQAKLAHAIDEMVTTEYPLLVHFIPNRDQFSKGAGEKIVRRVNEYLQNINSDQTHELRQKFDTVVTELIEKLRSDASLRNTIETLKSEAVQNPLIAEYVKSMGNDLKIWLDTDLKQSDSTIQRKIAESISGLGTILACNGELKASLNEYLEKMVHTYGDTARTAIAKHISETVQNWEHDEYVSEIELSIGSDLQFIRMNGTLVGGVIGLLLHAVTLFLR